MTWAIAFGGAAVVLGALSLRRGEWLHALAYVGSVAAMIAMVVASLGRPVPLAFVWPRLHNVALLAMLPREPDALYLWIKRDTDAQPIALAVPWSEKQAAAAHRALQEAARRHTQARWQADGKPGQGNGHGGAGSGHGTGQGSGAAGNGTGGQGQGQPGGQGFYASDVVAYPAKEAE